MGRQRSNNGRRAVWLGLLGGAAVLIVAPSAPADCHIRQLPADMAITTSDGDRAVLHVSDDSTIVVTTHVPDPFELTLSIGATGTAEISDLIPLNTRIDAGLTFSAADRFLWCVGTPQYCTPPFQGHAYMGFRFNPGDGVHYGWLGVYCQNMGFGNVVLRFNGAAYDTCAGASIAAGTFEAIIIGECDAIDFDCDGDTGTDADIEAFFACLAGTCPPAPCANDADFDNDGDAGTDLDIEAFFRVLAGGPCSLR
jgi:hypothetical protein